MCSVASVITCIRARSIVPAEKTEWMWSRPVCSLRVVCICLYLSVSVCICLSASAGATLRVCSMVTVTTFAMSAGSVVLREICVSMWVRVLVFSAVLVRAGQVVARLAFISGL
ncbi:hypothetical protein SAMN05443637_108197 [Pseudonocardia thermophila]|uniref:Uncharacterized protein n=1 Tax=Pseudonocardia thermophila TaxID=1848 RepID=A0A1M6TR48_PSETH|nr:hypothetical protein SAMN05443637_108197 [Pseudonocardia thermophila]